MLVITPLTSLFKIICLMLAFFTVILARGDSTPRHRGEYLALLLLATVGLMLLVGSEELLMIFIGLELTGLSLYVMAGFDKTDPRSAEAGLKYFLFGSTASAFTLFGLSLVYGMCGTTGLAAIGQKLAAGPIQPLLAAGIVMTLIGFALKSPPRLSIFGRPTLTRARRFLPLRSSPRARKSRRSWCLEKSCSSASVPHTGARPGTR